MTRASENHADKTGGTVEAAAREWLVRLYADDVSDDDRDAFRAWLSQSADHVKTYKALEMAWRDVGLAHGGGAGLLETRESVIADKLPHARWIAVAACLLVAIGTSLFGARHAAEEGWYTTGTGEMETVTLDDGTVVTLSARSSLETRLSGTRREARLVQGTAYFDVAKNPNRPFTVSVADTSVTVTGTEFDIRLGPDSVRVAVTEGSVEVVDASQEGSKKPPQASLVAGDQVIANLDGTITSQSHFDAEEIGAWRAGRLVYLDARLEDIVADANRYREQPIRLRDDELLDLRITTSFRVEDSDQMLAGLVASYPVRVRESDFSVSIWSKK